LNKPTHEIIFAPLQRNRVAVRRLEKARFSLRGTHLTEPERISRLIALLAIAFAWAHHTGEVLSHQQPIPFKKLSADPLRPSSVMALTSFAMSC
jgi:hypothetical protein